MNVIIPSRSYPFRHATPARFLVNGPLLLATVGDRGQAFAGIIGAYGQPVSIHTDTWTHSCNYLVSERDALTPLSERRSIDPESGFPVYRAQMLTLVLNPLELANLFVADDPALELAGLKMDFGLPRGLLNEMGDDIPCTAVFSHVVLPSEARTIGDLLHHVRRGVLGEEEGESNAEPDAEVLARERMRERRRQRLRLAG